MTEIVKCPRCSHACGNTIDRETGKTLHCQYCNYPRAEMIPVMTYRFDCATCGHPIEILEFSDGTQEVQPHYYCDKPRFTCLVDNPRRLDVISGTT